MTSELVRAYVWIWLPGAIEPVVCGVLNAEREAIGFAYARSYLQRDDAVPIYEPELPLVRGRQEPLAGQRLPLCIDDAMPDSWGRQVVNHRLNAPTETFGELTYLLQSSSDRIGALDFQAAPDDYVARGTAHPSLEDLSEAAHRIQEGLPLSPELEVALLQGSALGGARPKALVDDPQGHFIAKFSSTADEYPVVQGEFLAMQLADLCGLNVARVELRKANGRYALLVERFDRERTGARRRVVSALTVLGLDTFPGGRWANYALLADQIRGRFIDANATLRELFGRIAFNVLCSNSDDHGRNHAAFVDTMLELTPAYDICPQARFGQECNQAMAYTPPPDDITMGERESRIVSLIGAANYFHLSQADAQSLVDHQVDTIRHNWDLVCDAAELTQQQRDAFMGTQLLNPYALS